MKKLFRKIKVNNIVGLGIFLFLAFIILGLPKTANADLLDLGANILKTLAASPILMAIGVIAVLMTVLFGALNSLIIGALVTLTKYNNFINEPSIVDAWVVMRDLCNMFFILILLVIAFATILRIPNYEWKKILPKLLIMAVLINFSRTICGLIIDASQVIMLTFVNAWADSGGGFVVMTKMTTYFTSVVGNELGKFASAEYSVLNIVVGMLVGIMFLIISGIVLLVALAVFLMRVIMLWIYIVLSPLAFLAAAFPAGQKYATQWWSEFVKYIINGPVLAFFIWMAFITSDQITKSSSLVFGNEQCFGLTQGMCLNNFLPFIISIGMLLGGLIITQQIGGIGSSIAGKGLDWAKKSPMLLGGGAMFAGGWAGRKIKSGAVSSLFATKTVDDEGNVSWKGRAGLGGFGSGMARALYGLELRPTKMIEGIKEGIKSQAEKEEAQATGASAISLRRGGVGGLIKGLGVSRDLTESILGPGGILWHKGFNRVFQATLKGGQKGVADTEKELAGMRANRGVLRYQYNEKEKEFNANKIKINEDIKKASQAGNMVEVNRLGVEYKRQKDELESMKSRITTEPEKIKQQDAAIEKLEKKLSLRKPIQTFYADRAREELISKASKTMGDNDNEEALVEMFKDALANGNKEVAQAVMLHAAKVGHLNEVIQGYKSKRDVKDERGNLLVKKGGALPQGGYGLHEVVKQALMEDLGIDEHSALSTQSEASTLAKSVRHSNLSESVGSKNGFLFQRKIEEPGVGQMARARGEARKVDSERYLRDYNRLGWGDEFLNSAGDREFKLNSLGLDNFTELADIINKEITGRRLNKNAAMNIASDAVTLREWAKTLAGKGMTYYDGSADGGKGANQSYVELAERLIEYGNSVRQAQGKTEASSGIKKLQTEVLNKQTRPT